MKMVVVIGVRIRPEADAELAASPLMHRAQEAADALILAVPPLLDGDAAAVAKQESRNVDGIGEGMLAQAPA
jgi:hypothetical protein